jgi:hypothetical protein
MLPKPQSGARGQAVREPLARPGVPPLARPRAKHLRKLTESLRCSERAVSARNSHSIVAPGPIFEQDRGMYQTNVYWIDPASVAHHHFVAVALFTLVALVCLSLVAMFGRRSWWTLIAATIGLPTVIVLALGGAPGPPIPLTQFILDVVIPLAGLGLPAAILGSVLGAMLHWLLRRKSI